MDRRRFLKNLAVTAAGVERFSSSGDIGRPEEAPEPAPDTTPDTEGHTLVCEFTIGSTAWKVYEDLRTREGPITFLSSRGGKRLLTKSAEATFAEADPPYLGLSLKDIGMSGADLLADRLLQNGEPDPELVKAAAPSLGSATGCGAPGGRVTWNTFVGTKECFDTRPCSRGAIPEPIIPCRTFPN